MNRKLLFAILPLVLVISCSLVFYFSSRILGQYAGYLTGFLFYWLFWGFFIPRTVLKENVRVLFSRGRPFFVLKNWWIILLFLSTLVSPLFMYFIPKLALTPIPVIVLAIPLAVVHGFFEEAFWRGMYIREFPESIMWGIVIPTLLFMAWHIAPQLAISSGNRLVFIFSTLPLGLTYALVAYITKSARWSALGHSLSGIFAFSGFLSQSVYQLMQTRLF